MYFLQKGQAEIVIPKYDNIAYINLYPSNHFGLVDIVGCARKYGFDHENWNDNLHKLFRCFTVRAKKECELLYLSLVDLE